MKNGYEAVAAEFAARKQEYCIRPDIVLAWARDLPAGTAILELGCGDGVPMTEALIRAGYAVHGVDASPTLAALFHQRFPAMPVECAQVEDSAFFHRQFDAAFSWGLLFLLDEATQLDVIAKLARALRPRGRLLFTAPHVRAAWPDALTGEPSFSLGHAAYEEALAEHDLMLVDNALDEGENYYYMAVKR